MGLFSRIKRQLLKVVEWEDDSKNTIVYRYPLTDRDELMTSSTLVVRESQCAIFVHKGEIADVFGPGTYKLSTENIPFLTKLLSLPSGFESRIKADIYYINTKQFIGQKWGTQNPIMMRDEEFGNVRIRAYGVYSFKVTEPKTFMRQVFGTNSSYTTEDASNQIRPMLIQGITDTIADSKISALDLAANYKEFSTAVLKYCKEELAELGLGLTKFVIENISLPEEVEKTLDERTKLGVLEDRMGTYTQKKTADALLDSANNPNGNNLAGLGVGLGAGVTMSNVFSTNLATEDKPREIQKGKSVICEKCGSKNSKTAKFCSECGQKLGNKKRFCPECGAEVSGNSKFCSECGQKLD